MISTTSALVLSLGLLFLVLTDVVPLYAQQNQTSNTTSTQQGQQQGQEQNQTTGIGTASEIENITAGNIPVIGNETDIQSQNDTSVTQGMQQEQVTTDTNMTDNQTGTGGGGATNETAATNQTRNQTGGGGEEGQQQLGNQTGQGPLEQIGEAISDVFKGGGGGENPSN